ncbi:PaaI family thioesterase [Nocardioides panacihumi]|uniref:Acyl-coenzyme A thioesterase THEM4 n=1 Tax=Nocardioides panacihumi TaxID=400774 RepID=A0ABN2RKA2_9ACTN
MTRYLEDTATERLEADEREGLYGPLAEAVRALVDASIRTEVDDHVIRQATADLERIAGHLRAHQLPGSYGVHSEAPGRRRTWGSPVIGVRNPIAPPLTLQHAPDGLVWSEFRVGTAYEGPPGRLHGGMAALILDHVLGEAVSASGHWGLTGTLTLRYRRGTPLGRLRTEARIDRVEGRKAYVVGSIADDEGITVEAEAIFILPKGYVHPDATA